MTFSVSARRVQKGTTLHRARHAGRRCRAHHGAEGVRPERLGVVGCESVAIKGAGRASRRPQRRREGGDRRRHRGHACGHRHISLMINIYFSILPNQQRARSDFCLISYVVNYGRVGKCIMRKSKRYADMMPRIRCMCLRCWTGSSRH
jgi:hypothetical protein